MKKIINLFLVALLIFSNVEASKLDSLTNNITKSAYNDGKSTISTLHQDSKQLLTTAHNDALTLSNYLGIRLDSIASKTYKTVGSITTNLWDILVKQQKVFSYTMLFIWLLASLSIIRALKYLTVHTKLEEPPLYLTWFYGSWLVLGIVSFIFCSTHTYDVMTGIFNPEYGALTEVTKLIKENLTH